MLIAPAKNEIQTKQGDYMKAQAFLASVAALFMSLSSQAHTIVNDFDCSKLPKQTQVAEPLKYDVEIEDTETVKARGPGMTFFNVKEIYDATKK